jgi:flagellar hook-length control protein FliK
MQLNSLSGLAAAPRNGDVPALDTGGQISSEPFAQLLADSEGEQEPETKRAPYFCAEKAPSALVAQEVGRQDADPLDREITPAQAAELAAQLSGDGQGNGAALKQQVREALEKVAQGDTPKKLGEILNDVTALQAPAAQHGNGQPGTLMRVLAWMQQSLDKKKEAPVQDAAAEEGAAALDPTAQSLQALAFCGAGDAETATKAAKPEKEQKVKTVIDIVPLAQTVTMQAPPSWLQHLTGGSDPALDAAIPPLALAGDEALPLVSLPAAANDEAPQTGTDAAPETAPTTDSNWPSQAETWLKKLPFPLAVSEANAGEPSADAALPPTDPAVNTAAPVTAKAGDVAGARKPVIPAALNPLFSPDGAGAAHATAAMEKRAAIVGADAKTDETLVINAASPATYTRAGSLPDAVHAPNAYAHGGMQSAADQVHVAIRNAAKDNIDHITIQLDPADLGRVEVKMTMQADGRTHLSFIADKASTLDLLARDAQHLERSLSESGIKADAGGMQFNLRQQPQFVETGFQQGGGRNRSAEADEEMPAASRAPTSIDITPARSMTLHVKGGIDIHA